MNFFRWLAVICVLVFACPKAYAGGDLTDYKPLPIVAGGSSCGGTFSGWYGGVLLGMGGYNSKADVADGVAKLKDNDRGFTVGGVGGYNWQCNGRLLGIESDISYFDADAVPGIAGSGCPTCAEERLNFGSEINWFGTLRGRIGLVGDQNFLVFATGGLAYGGIDHSMTVSGPVSGSLLSRSDTQVGWTVGGGLEYLLSEHWSFRADALYVDLGSEDHTFTTSVPEVCGTGTCSLHSSWNDSFWVARVGLTYLFGTPAPIVYTPLK